MNTNIPNANTTRIGFNRNNTRPPQKSKDVLSRIKEGCDAKVCIDEYLTLKNDRAEAKLVKLLTGLLKKESSTQNNDHRTNYRQALVAIHEWAQERPIDISRLVNVLPIEDLDRGIIAPQITRLVTGTSPENYVRAILGFFNTITESKISTEKETALLNSITSQLTIAIQFCSIEIDTIFVEEANEQLAHIHTRIKNDKNINLYLKWKKHTPTDKQTKIEELTKKITELEQAKTKTTTFLKSSVKTTNLWEQWISDPLSVQFDDIPQLPALLPTEPKIHPLERSKTT